MKWWVYKDEKGAPERQIPWGYVVLFFVIVIAVCVGIRAVTWPGNKHVDGAFFADAVILPFSILMTIMCFGLMLAGRDTVYFSHRKFIADRQSYAVKAHARQHMIVADWSLLSPLEIPALNMLKLEGDFPLAPKTPLTIQFDEEYGVSRTTQILTKLISPLTGTLKNNHYNGFETYLWVRGGDETCAEELRALFKQFDIPRNKDLKINVLGDCPDYSLINKWIAISTGFNGMHRLLIIIDVHEEGEESKSMENAGAFFLTKSYCKSNEGQKPVYLYQPMADLNDIETATPVFIGAGAVSSPKTLWFTGLSRTEKYPLMRALDDNQLALNRLDLEESLGEKTAGYQWFAMGLAADAVKYAQGEQLIAASEQNKFGLAALSSKFCGYPAKIAESDYPHAIYPAALSGLFLVVSIIMVIADFLDIKIHSPFVGLFIILAPLFIMVIIGITMTGFALGEAENDMWRQQ